MATITLKDLASKLNLSTATVSRALRDSYDIGAETKKRVKELAKELNFSPNPNASNLRSQSTKTIAIVIPEIANNFFALAINGIEEIAREKGYHVLIYLSHELHTKEVSILQHLLNGRVDGVLMSMASETENIDHINELIKNKIPLVFFDRVREDIDAAKIVTDDRFGGFSATKHLLERGCKKIAYLSLSSRLKNSIDRFNGYKDALIESALEFDSDNFIDCGNDNKHNFSLIYKLLTRKNNKVDGIFSASENLVLLTYQICKELNIKVPQQLKVITFSNSPTSSFLSPSLSTITQPAYDIGKEAASLLFKSIEKKKVDYSDVVKVLKSNLLIRNSSS
ncbi:MAG: LacI family DNA-binding transcriptional regulator [Bacteroidetes bacterium]|nr:LacI family DNA-binding transcriptional regulator [Bacteroidota bacterium]